MITKEVAFAIVFIIAILAIFIFIASTIKNNGDLSINLFPHIENNYSFSNVEGNGNFTANDGSNIKSS